MTPDSLVTRRVEACRGLIRDRKVIGLTLGYAICPCPTLDMLLDLCLAELEQRETYLWSLCMAANAPFSTAHRKVAALESEGLVQRVSDRQDLRRILLFLSEQGRAYMMDLLDQSQA